MDARGPDVNFLSALSHPTLAAIVVVYVVLLLITLWFSRGSLRPSSTPPGKPPTQPPTQPSPIAEAKPPSEATPAQMDTLLQRLSGLPPDRLAELCAELVEAEPRLYARVESALAIRYPIRPAPLPPLPFELTEVCGIAAMPDAPILCVALTEGER